MTSQFRALGYDPGGNGRHGIASLLFDGDGRILATEKVDILGSAADAIEWLSKQSDVRAIGIDTLLAWCPSGSRPCDNALRRTYKDKRASVIAQNSLYSAMTLNGAMLAMEASKRNIPLLETHPKLVLYAKWPDERARTNLKAIYDQQWAADGADHAADAIVAAYCAAQSVLGRWDTDLFDIGRRDEYIFPAGHASFPWPEPMA